MSLDAPLPPESEKRVSEERVKAIAGPKYGYPTIRQADAAGGAHPTYLVTESEARALAREVVELRKDRKRLDWLQQVIRSDDGCIGDVVLHGGFISVSVEVGRGKIDGLPDVDGTTLRDAIDLASEEYTPSPPPWTIHSPPPDRSQP